MQTSGYLGIDLGTQGLTALLVDPSFAVVAAGSGNYSMCPGLPEGDCEQQPEDWWLALIAALADLRHQLAARGLELRPAVIGISGQMHGEVLCDSEARPLAPARLWCDSRNQAEGDELTALFAVKVPKRMTCARWLWTARNRPELADRVRRMSTPGGWLARRLTGQWRLGVGDASGMFPVDPSGGGYDSRQMIRWEQAASGAAARLAALLPDIRRAGEDGGALSESAAAEIELAPGIPVAPAEGDQPAAMAGSLIGQAGAVSMSFGTSICANSVSDRDFAGVHPAVDHFRAADGKPINMVLLRNGTGFLSAVAGMFGDPPGDESSGFRRIMPQLLAAPPDCGGLLALPFMDDEPGLGIGTGGTALFLGLNSRNATPGNMARAALLATIFNLQSGTDVLGAQGMPLARIVLSGGLTRTPELGQIVADAFEVPVSIRGEGAEGSAYGAALLAAYRHARLQDPGTPAWETWLATAVPSTAAHEFRPRPDAAGFIRSIRERYRRLLGAREALQPAAAQR